MFQGIRDIMLCYVQIPEQQGTRAAHSHSVGRHQQVYVVEEADGRELQHQHVNKLNEEHEEQLPDAADLQEDRAGQQAKEHTGGEILPGGERRALLRTDYNRRCEVTLQMRLCNTG